MSGLVDALLIVVAVVVVIVRQFRASRIDTGRRWWLLPVVLAVVALREPGLVDAQHRTASVALLTAELLTGLVIGAGWAWTSRIWTEPDGAVWSRSTKASGAVWAVGIGLRVALFGLGAALGVHQDPSALLLALAATLLVRSGTLDWRARSLSPAAAPAPAYGQPMVRSSGKERV